MKQDLEESKRKKNATVASTNELWDVQSAEEYNEMSYQ